MLAIGNEYKNTKNSYLLARDTKSNKPVYWIPNETYPKILPSGNVLSLVDDDWLLKFFKKYSLNKDQIQKLIEFYKDSDNISLKLKDWKLQTAFHKLEEHMLGILKSRFQDVSMSLEPYHDPDNLRGLAAISASYSGKSYLIASILLRPEFRKRTLYIFTPNTNDSSLLRLKERGKKTKFVDMNRIKSPLSLSDFPPDSLVLMDDAFEHLPRKKSVHGFDLRGSLLHLCNQILTRGRHHKTRNGPGMSLILVAHILKGGIETKTLWSELQGGLYLFPSASKHTIVDFLKSKIGLSKLDVTKILELAGSSRFVCFKLSKPMCAIWSTGIYLL